MKLKAITKWCDTKEELQFVVDQRDRYQSVSYWQTKGGKHAVAIPLSEFNNIYSEYNGRRSLNG